MDRYNLQEVAPHLLPEVALPIARMAAARTGSASALSAMATGPWDLKGTRGDGFIEPPMGDPDAPSGPATLQAYTAKALDQVSRGLSVILWRIVVRLCWDRPYMAALSSNNRDRHGVLQRC